MGTFVNGMPAPRPGDTTTVDINQSFLRLTTLFNSKKITKEEYRARVAELVGKHKPTDKGLQVVGLIAGRQR